MNVAFISECNTFYNILTKSINLKNPRISFYYYDSPLHFNQQLQINYSYFIIKITNFEKYEEAIKKIINSNPRTKFIGLVIDNRLKLSDKLLALFSNVFIDYEIEDKLNILFSEAVGNQNLQKSALLIEKNKRKYLYLKPEYSRCFYLVYQRKTAAEIGQIMNKSKRTIEKYIDALKVIFEVKRKQDLIGVCAEIIQD